MRKYKFDTGLAESQFEAETLDEAWEKICEHFKDYKNGRAIGIIYIEDEIPTTYKKITTDWYPIRCATIGEELPDD